MREEEYMRLAIRLARKAAGRTSPNPLVGAVVVKEGEIVGKGFHRKAGEPHAEVNALNDSGEKARDGELYVNLEPCNHYGRTPPCTDMIIKSGIKKVFVGMEDPNERVAGKGIQFLRDNGIYVKTGIMREKCERLNEIFTKYIQEKVPFVILKSAVTLDGKIATRIGDTRWITNERSRAYVHRLRDEIDGIMVGIGTVAADNPSLTTRLGTKKGQNPTKIIVDSRLNISLDARVLNSDSQPETIIATTEWASREKIRKLERLGARVLVLGSENNRVDLKELMVELGKLEICGLLIEGGAEVNASSLHSGIVDKVLFFYAPKIIGGNDALSVVGGHGVDKLEDALLLKEITIRRFGEDTLIQGYIRK